MAKITFHGHAFLEIEHGGKIILIDPFVEGNIHNDLDANEIKCDYIILTHGHGDHYGSCIEIAKKNDATIIAVFELAENVTRKGCNAHAMQIGGSYSFPFGKVKFTIAHHSSSTPDGEYTGEAAGVILTLGDKIIYHAGDTGLFYDMKLIGDMNKIDHAFLPIGDNFTMGIDDAVKAAEFINASVVTPVHFDTFDVIKSDPEEFKRKIESIGKKCLIMNPGDTIEL
jgi:L-ascorbate metabolism protein UlaG (beta-lactamase superfamily)